eukprot:gene6797-30767_t
MMQCLMFFAVLISGTGIYIAMGVSDHEGKIKAAGYLAVTVLLLYYSSPLSVLAKVLTTRNSASLYWPLSVMCCVNGALWIAYGLAVGDAFIWAPNVAGAALGERILSSFAKLGHSLQIELSSELSSLALVVANRETRLSVECCPLGYHAPYESLGLVASV